MSAIQFDRVNSSDPHSIEMIAQWYFTEWQIPHAKTIKNISGFPNAGFPFQLLMSVEKIPVATGGLYEHVGLLDIAPKFRIYGPWLALILTTPENRNRRHGTLFCEEIQNRSRELGLKEIFLFTRTAETLYTRMGWVPIEKRNIQGRNVAVMKKVLG